MGVGLHTLRAEYDGVRAALEELSAMTDEDAIAAHVAAYIQAGRELTPAEAQALLIQHRPSRRREGEARYFGQIDRKKSSAASGVSKW